MPPRLIKAFFCHISPIGKKWKSPQKRLYYCKRLDQNYKTRQGVYVIAKNWTKDFRITQWFYPLSSNTGFCRFCQNRPSQELHKTTKRLYSSKEVDQTIFLGHFFTQDRRPIGRHLPHLRLRFVGINRYAIVMFAAYAARKICRATPHWNEAEATVKKQRILAEPNSKLGEVNDCKLDNIRRVFRKQRNEKWQNIWGMSAANFAMKNPHTHSKILGNQNAIPQKILT